MLHTVTCEHVPLFKLSLFSKMLHTNLVLCFCFNYLSIYQYLAVDIYVRISIGLGWFTGASAECLRVLENRSNFLIFLYLGEIPAQIKAHFNHNQCVNYCVPQIQEKGLHCVDLSTCQFGDCQCNLQHQVNTICPFWGKVRDFTAFKQIRKARKLQQS